MTRLADKAVSKDEESKTPRDKVIVDKDDHDSSVVRNRNRDSSLQRLNYSNEDHATKPGSSAATATAGDSSSGSGFLFGKLK